MFFKDVHVIILGMGIFFYVHFQSLYMVEGKRASFHFVTGVSEYYFFCPFRLPYRYVEEVECARPSCIIGTIVNILLT